MHSNLVDPYWIDNFIADVPCSRYNGPSPKKDSDWWKLGFWRGGLIFDVTFGFRLRIQVCQDQLPLFKALEARTPRTQKMRILILTFKNHALDEFLLDCRKHCPDADIVRIGRMFWVFFSTVLPYYPSTGSLILRWLVQFAGGFSVGCSRVIQHVSILWRIHDPSIAPTKVDVVKTSSWSLGASKQEPKRRAKVASWQRCSETYLKCQGE